MQKIFFILLFLISLVIAGVGVVLVTPYYQYNSIVNKNDMSEWFTIANHRKLLIKPSPYTPFELPKKINKDLWEKFHFKTLEIPLPVRNPFFFVAPILKYNKIKRKTEFGLSIFDSKDEVLAQIYILPSINMPKVLNNQKIFELPLVRNHLLKKSAEMIWKDIFIKDISAWNISYSEMLYHLYLLQLRSILVTKNTKNFYFDEEFEKGVLELTYADKDYNSEIILSKRGAQISSFLLIYKKESPEAEVIKYQMMGEMTYQDTTPNLTEFLYNEFKGLSYQDQIDHVGLLYLLSSWSHDQRRLELLVSAVKYLERGKQNQRQLEPLYNYLYARVGKTFSKRMVENLKLDSTVLLKRNAELEKALKKTVIKEEPIPEKTLTVKEQYEKILKETKQRIKSNSKTMIMN